MFESTHIREFPTEIQLVKIQQELEQTQNKLLNKGVELTADKRDSNKLTRKRARNKSKKPQEQQQDFSSRTQELSSRRAPLLFCLDTTFHHYFCA